MKPDITPPPGQAAPAKAAANPAETPLAEPPKNLEFTEVTPDESRALPVPPVAPPAPAKPTEAAKPIQKPAPKSPAAAPKTSPPSEPMGPGVLISVAVLIFVALIIVAYEAYRNSN